MDSCFYMKGSHRLYVQIKWPRAVGAAGAVAHKEEPLVSSTHSTPRRVRVPGDKNHHVYRRWDGRYEIGFRDSTGKQRWPGPFDTITQARAERDKVLGKKASGERVAPNPRLTFGEAADRWLAEQVTDLRPSTRANYRNSVENHLRHRWGKRRMDTITVDDCAKLVRELRGEGKAEATIATVLRAATRAFKFASRRMGWHGTPPTLGLENGERPKLSQTAPRRIFQGDELAQTLRAAHEPFRTLFALAAVTGARESELLGLVWSDLDVSDSENAYVTFSYQADRQGKRQPLKTEQSRRRVEIPRSLALVLLEHKARAVHCAPADFVFATKSGRAIGQRNVLRELRRAMKAARDGKGRPTFPVLQEGGPVARGSVPTFHSFRHSAASQAIADGDSAEEISWQLGHKNSVVTRTVYIREIQSAERQAKRRDKMEVRYGSMLGSAVEATDGSGGQQTATGQGAEVLPLLQKSADGDGRQRAAGNS